MSTAPHPRERHAGMAERMAHLAHRLERPALQDAFTPWDAREHRLELVAEKDGVRYVNDSFATNVNATYMALEFTPGPIVWIMGGTDKGNDYADLVPLVRAKVEAQYILAAPENRWKPMATFRPLGHVVLPADSMAEAVVAASILAEPGTTVLLSPACASFDLFADFEDRGWAFKGEVGRL